METLLKVTKENIPTTIAGVAAFPWTSGLPCHRRVLSVVILDAKALVLVCVHVSSMVKKKLEPGRVFCASKDQRRSALGELRKFGERTSADKWDIHPRACVHI